jgi:hypothetical protein
MDADVNRSPMKPPTLGPPPPNARGHNHIDARRGFQVRGRKPLFYRMKNRRLKENRNGGRPPRLANSLLHVF